MAPEVARRACVAALADLGWHIEADTGDGIRAREEPSRLPCHVTPASARLLVSGGERSSAVNVEIRVPGIGPIATSHARGSQSALVRRVHEAATSAGESYAT